MIVATAGHIDHGKTTLVRALTGMDTDRLPQEKARGISIEAGFAHADLPGGGTVGFVDVPGHERFVHNMLSGVYAIGHVLLVVAADDGVMPQTREHLNIMMLLGVPAATLVITKADRAEPARVAEVAREAGGLLRQAGFGEAPVLAVSAFTGAGLDALRAHLAAVVAGGPAAHDDDPQALARFVVDQVFTVTGSGTVARGTVLSGAVHAGDTLVISPGGLPARVRKLQRHGQAVASPHAGQRCALNLAQVDRHAIARGDWLVAPDAHRPTDRLDVQVRALPSEAAPLSHWLPVHVHIGAADVPGRLALRRGASIAPGDEAWAQLRLTRPVHAAWGDRFILRDQSATRTIGGGRVVDAFPPLRGKLPQRVAVLEALCAGSPAQALERLLAAGEAVDMAWLAGVFNLGQEAALALLPAGAVCVRTEPPVALSGAQVAQLCQATTDAVRRFHTRHRQAGGVALARVQQEVARGLRADVYAELVRSGFDGAGLLLRGSELSLVGHDATDNPRDRAAWQRVQARLRKAALAIPSVRELAAGLALPLQPLRDLLHRKAAQGALVKLTPERFALPETVDALAAHAVQTAQQVAGGGFTAAQYRDTIGTGRSLAIEILECLDRRGITHRQGELRRLR